MAARLGRVDAKLTGKRLLLITHSWGSVLTYIALRRSTRLKPGSVDLWVTLGSPLGARGPARLARVQVSIGTLAYPLTRPPPVTVWKNLWTTNLEFRVFQS